MLPLFLSISYSLVAFGVEQPHLSVNGRIRFQDNVFTFLYPCLSSNECTSLSLSLPKGLYKFEVWGADGGNTPTDNGGKGGYSSGEILFEKQTKVFIHVGGSGAYNASKGIQPGGYNGGGNGYHDSISDFGAGGGGATDIRVLRNKLSHRLIVAGGGGGAGNGVKSSREGGYGGGTEAGYGQFWPNYFQVYRCLISGANQTNQGISQWFNGTGTWREMPSRFTIKAGFGNGQTFLTTDGSGWAAGGGGGGWYGGACGCVGGGSGSGGSGYVLSETSYIPPEYILPLSFTLTNTIIKKGIDLGIPDPRWNESINLNGNGAARITFINVSNSFANLFITCARPYSRVINITNLLLCLLINSS